MFVAVTGGTGFIGRELVARLAARGDRVRVLTRQTTQAFDGLAAVEICNCDLVTASVAELSTLLEGVEVIYHCAGQLKSGAAMRDLHVDGTRKLVEAASTRVAHWVQLSSVGVYGPQSDGLVTEETSLNPSGEYEKTKAESDQIVLDAASRGAFTCSILRPSNVFGSKMTNQSLFSMIEMVDRGLFFFVGEEGSSANYIHVDNVVEALIRCGTDDRAKGKIYNLSDHCTLEYFVGAISDALGRSRTRLRLPRSMVDLVENLVGWIPGFPLTQPRIRALVGCSQYRISRIENDLAYRHVISMNDAVMELVEGYRQKNTKSAPSSMPQPAGRRQRDGNKFSLPPLAILWIAFFSYTTSVALLFQYLVLPMVPSLHAGQGLLSQDSLYFHRVAQTLADAIARDGWSAWTPWPTPSAHGNVAVLAALYAIFGPNPSSAIPINACIHASSGLLLILIGRELSSSRPAHWGALVAACLFIGFPSALNWYGQIHKDGYGILGFLLVLYSGVKLLRLERLREAANPLIAAGAGLALTAFARPNNLQLFQIMAVGMLVLAAIMFRRMNIRSALQAFFSVMIILTATIVHPPVGQLDESIGSAYSEQETGALANWHWTPSSVLPAVVDVFAQKLSNLRVFMAAHGVRENAGSMVDLDSMPSNMGEFLGYLPRATMVGMFAPFPGNWLSKISLARMVGVAETFLWYVIFPGLLWSAWQRRRDPVLWWLLGCALTILTVESYMTANLGTLHRVRYPFLFVLILLGTIGWAEAISKCWWRNKEIPQPPTRPDLSDLPDRDADVRKVGATGADAMAAARRGLLVVVLTGCLFIGLFARDILLVRVLGLGADLDSYQLATFIPLFVTALLAVPLGPVLITQFMGIRQREGKEAAASWIGAMGGASLGVFVMLSFAVAGVVWFGVFGAVSESMHASVGGLMLWLLPVVALSGSVVLGNAVLMANSRAVSATLAQLAVPLISVLLILVLGSGIGAVAAAAGLMLGQLINYLLVARTSHSLGYSIRPRFGSTRWREWAGQYAPLVATSALTSAAIPVGVYFASQLPEGSVAAFSMGSKVLQSMTALISAALIAVVLPYFSRLFAANRLLEVRRSLQLLLSLGTAFAVPFAFVLFVSADEIAAILFAGGRIGATEIKHLASVIQYGALQFPFYVVLVVLIKFTIAGRETLWVLVAAVLGQLANIAGALLLVGRFGTAGLAMSMTLGIAVSSLLLLLWATIRQHMSWMSSALVVISWMLFFTLAVCVHYGSVPGSIVCVLAFFALMLGELGLSSRGGFRESLAA